MSCGGNSQSEPTVIAASCVCECRVQRLGDNSFWHLERRTRLVRQNGLSSKTLDLLHLTTSPSHGAAPTATMTLHQHLLSMRLNSNQAVTHILANAPKGGLLYYCTGPALCGRTFICDHLSLATTAPAKWAPRTHRHLCKQSDIGHEPITAALRKFAKEDGLSRSKLSRIAKDGIPGALRSVRAVANYYLPFVPSELDNVINTLASSLQDGVDTKAFPQASVDILIGLLKLAVLDAETKEILLIIDSLEEMPEPGVLLISALLQEPIPGLTVVVTVNSESAATQQKEHQILRARLQYKSPRSIIEIVGHTCEEICEWKQRIGGSTINKMDGELAYTVSLSGRSGLLAPWVESNEVGPSLIEAECARLYGQLDIEYSQATDKNRLAIIVLAQCYPDYVPLDELANSIGVSKEEVLRIRDQLAGSFVDDTMSGIGLKRRSVFDFIFQRAGAAALACNWSTRNIQHSANPENGVQMNAAIDHRLGVIEHDLKRGATQAAYERIDVTLKLGLELGSARPTLLRHLADVHDQRGEYGKAIECVNEALALNPVEDELQELRLALATLQFRVGKGRQSLSTLNAVRKRAAASGSTDSFFYAVLRSISVLIEMDKTLTAVNVSRTAILRRNETPPGEKVDSHLRRIAARALALSPETRDVAKNLAAEAYAIAKRSLGERAEGNCLYCLGDVYRHCKDAEKAKSFYEQALKIAGSNFDLILYCYLGLAALALSSDRDEDLRLVLIEVSQLPITVDSPEWAAVSTYVNVYAALGYEVPPAVTKFAHQSGSSIGTRRWQQRLSNLTGDAKTGLVSKSQFRHELASTMIVL